MSQSENNTSKPVVNVVRSEDDQRWIVQVDTAKDTGHITVYVNDGPAQFDADPEVG